MSSNDFTPKNPKNFRCEICDFNTTNKKDYNRHLETIKHKNKGNQCFSTKKTPKNPYECICGKMYKDNSGLWRHKKNCSYNNQTCNNSINNNNINYQVTTDKDELINYLIKESQELKGLILEIAKKDTYNQSTNTTTTNSHNKSFNLQFFLNETCKDAMNIMDFVDSIKLQLSDLERVGELGYVEGISNIITTNLKALDVTQRPVHCTDKKREVLYVKDEDKWEKEDENKAKIHKIIKKVADKNMRLIPTFKEKHPDCGKSSSRFSDQYNKIIVESMGGSGDNDLEKEERIIKNISKQVTLDKQFN
jgi:hypothetical protein